MCGLCFPEFIGNIISTFEDGILKVSLSKAHLIQFFGQRFSKVIFWIQSIDAFLDGLFPRHELVHFQLLSIGPPNTFGFLGHSISLGQFFRLICRGFYASSNSLFLTTTVIHDCFSCFLAKSKSNHSIANGIQGATFSNRLDAVNPGVILFLGSKGKYKVILPFFRHPRLDHGAKITVTRIGKEEVCNGTRNKTFGDKTLCLCCNFSTTLQSSGDSSGTSLYPRQGKTRRLTGSNNKAENFSRSFTNLSFRSNPKIIGCFKICIRFAVTINSQIKNRLGSHIKDTLCHTRHALKKNVLSFCSSPSNSSKGTTFITLCLNLTTTFQGLFNVSAKIGISSTSNRTSRICYEGSKRGSWIHILSVELGLPFGFPLLCFLISLSLGSFLLSLALSFLAFSGLSKIFRSQTCGPSGYNFSHL